MKKYIIQNNLISSKRLKQLQKQFIYNYKNLSRQYFYSLTTDKQLKLLENEFINEKHVLVPSNYYNRLIRSRIRDDLASFLYCPTIHTLMANPDHFIHVRHNAYRTISAMLLKDCTIDEKILVLTCSTNVKTSSRILISCATSRLEVLANISQSTNLSL